MRRKIYLISFVVIILVLLGFSKLHTIKHQPYQIFTQQQLLHFKHMPIYSYKVIKTFPHNPNNFTEGLYYANGLLYESSGLVGQSTLQIRRLNSIKPIKEYRLPKKYFAEGITILGNRLYQLTYKTKVGFVYNKNSLKLLKTFQYNSEGWGLTNDGKNIIMSDGTATLHFLNPQTLKETKRIFVYHGRQKIGYINEMAYVHEKIYANVWKTDMIAIISPKTGELIGLINLAGINPDPAVLKGEFVLNGIAYNKANDTFFVTGKHWPTIFEIKILRK